MARVAAVDCNSGLLLDRNSDSDMYHSAHSLYKVLKLFLLARIRDCKPANLCYLPDMDYMDRFPCYHQTTLTRILLYEDQVAEVSSKLLLVDILFLRAKRQYIHERLGFLCMLVQVAADILNVMLLVRYEILIRIRIE